MRKQVYILLALIENVCLKQCNRLNDCFLASPLWQFSVFVWILFLSDVERLKKELDELVNALEKHFFQPEKNNLQRKTE